MSSADFDALSAVAPTVSRETFSLLKSYEQAIRRWNGRINLVSTASIDSLWHRHIVDCAQLPDLKPLATHWLDLGSGAGLPGLVISIMIRYRAGALVELVESNRKKSAFLTSVAGDLGLPVRVHAQRIEAVASGVEDPQIITARALAPLPKLLELAWPWLENGSCGLFQKGRDYEGEIVCAGDVRPIDLIKHNSQSHPGGVILEIRRQVADEA